MELCKICNRRADDVHHIDNKGMGGRAHYIEAESNKITLCRLCHSLITNEVWKLQFSDGSSGAKMRVLKGGEVIAERPWGNHSGSTLAQVPNCIEELWQKAIDAVPEVTDDSELSQIYHRAQDMADGAFALQCAICAELFKRVPGTYHEKLQGVADIIGVRKTSIYNRLNVVHKFGLDEITKATAPPTVLCVAASTENPEDALKIYTDSVDSGERMTVKAFIETVKPTCQTALAVQTIELCQFLSCSKEQKDLPNCQKCPLNQ